MQETCTGKPQC